MSDGIAEFVSTLFSSVWDLFSIDYPGFSFSFGAVAIGALVTVVSLRILSMFTGISFDSFSIGSTLTGYGKGWSLKEKKISVERRNDRINNFKRKGS